MELKKAEKKKVKLKIGLSGASGFGKTYSALLLAYGICQDWEKIAVVDTENGSASLYSGLGGFLTIDLKPPFSPERYIQSIELCEKSGVEVIILDSISHEWDGTGGCLQIADSLGGRFQDWAKVTPRHNKFIDKILRSSSHIITTTRRKQDYDMTKQGNKTKVQKVGTKEIMRDGFEYELTLNLELINDKNMAASSKDRTGLFHNEPEFVISKETGKKLMSWANDGVDEKDVFSKDIEIAKNREQAIELFNKLPKELKADKDILELLNQDKFKEKK